MRVLTGLIGAGLMIVVGCTRDAPTAGSIGAGFSPRDTVERLIALRATRKYDQMLPMIVKNQRHEVVRYLPAIDEFLNAGRVLCEHVRGRHGVGVAALIDFSHLAGNLDIFSEYVAVLDESVDGDAASVAYTVDRRLPVRHARLRRVGDRWLYDPGQGYGPQLIPALRKMSEGLRRTLQEMQSGNLKQADFAAFPEELVEAVRIRILPGVKMLPLPPAESDDGG